jgi:hypothetical protein
MRSKLPTAQGDSACRDAEELLLALFLHLCFQQVL